MTCKMNKTKIFITSTISLLFLSSCASAPNTTSEEKHLAHDKSAHTEVETIIETPEEIFLKSIAGFSVKKVSSPKEITKGRSFSEPFVFSVTKEDGTPVEGLTLTLLYPESKTDGIVTTGNTELTTDADGKISFTAPKPDFAVNTKVIVYPKPVSDDSALTEELTNNYSATADWKVKSDIASKGAVLFVWDFNEKDRPVNNSYNIQAEFRGRGITMVGNGPVNETSYIGKPKALYKDTYDIIGGTQYGYLIYGTIKFEQPVTALEDGTGYYCILKAEIEAVSMKNGNKIYSSVISYKEIGKNWNECVSKGKDKLSEFVVTDIIYGL